MILSELPHSWSQLPALAAKRWQMPDPKALAFPIHYRKTAAVENCDGLFKSIPRWSDDLLQKPTLHDSLENPLL
jgi:hypothetical protein